MFQEETKGVVCLAFLKTLRRENIVSDAREAALAIQASTATVIMIFAWHTDVGELFVHLDRINVRNKKFR